MIRWIRKRNFIQKLIAFFVLLIVIPLLLAYWIVSNRLAALTEQQMGETLFQLVKTGHPAVDRDIASVENTTERFMFMDETLRMFNKSPSSEYERLQRYLTLDKLLAGYSKHSINFSLFIPELAEDYPFAPTPYVKPNGVFFDWDSYSSDWFEKAVQAKGSGILVNLDQTGHNPGRLQTTAFVRAMSQYPGENKPVGVLVMTGLDALLRKDLESLKIPEEGQIILLNKSNAILANNSNLETGSAFELPSSILHAVEGVYIDRTGTDSWLYAFHTSTYSNTKLLFKIPIRSIIGEHVAMRQLVHYLMLAYFGLLLMVSIYFFRGFLDMTKRLNRTTIDKYHLELKHKEAELTILHSQINPHLLYNTLESILWRTTIEGNTESAAMIRDLSLLLRIGLSRGKSLIPIAEELMHVEAYLRLQLKRNNYSFAIHWHVEEEAKSLLIPKVVLQPLVENAIIHGIRKMDEDGHLWISVEISQNQVHIRVEDNGYRQVDVSRMNDIVCGLRPQEGFGIRNVHKRIKLHFGDAYGLSFEPRTGGGLRTILTIPATSEES
jgi:two-component system sensor histidine kinase YesM